MILYCPQCKQVLVFKADRALFYCKTCNLIHHWVDLRAALGVGGGQPPSLTAEPSRRLTRLSVYRPSLSFRAGLSIRPIKRCLKELEPRDLSLRWVILIRAGSAEQ